MIQAPVVACGGANADIHSRLLAPARMRDSNPGAVSFSAGGVARNIAENIARLGFPCRLLSAVGADAFGQMVLAACRTAGIDTDAVYRSKAESTSVYLDINDCAGDMLIASSDMHILGTLPGTYFAEQEELLSSAAAIIADGNLSEQQLSALLSAKGSTPVCVDPVSAAKAPRFLPFLSAIDTIKPNRLELEVLSGLPCESDTAIREAAEAVLKRGVHRIAVSLGAKGCYYADTDGAAFFASLPPVACPVSATGAGDSFTAGLIAGLLLGYTPQKAVSLALGCGALTVQSALTVSPSLSLSAALAAASNLKRSF